MSFFKTFLAKPSKGSLFSALVADRPVNVERDIAYGNHSRHRLDVYRPVVKTRKTPIVVFLYGGGWDSGEKEFYGFVGSAFASIGCIAVIPDYRLYPEVRYPEFMKDATHSYNWAVQNLTKGEPAHSPVFISGHSAGAHIGALLCYDPQYLDTLHPKVPSPQGFIGLSGPYGFDPTTHHRSRHIFVDAQNAAQVQPVNQVRKGAPPAILMHGAKDTTVKTQNAYRMRDRLSEAGSYAHAIEYEGIGHTGLVLTLARLSRHRASVLERIAEFINSQSAL